MRLFEFYRLYIKVVFVYSAWDYKILLEKWFPISRIPSATLTTVALMPPIMQPILIFFVSTIEVYCFPSNFADFTSCKWKGGLDCALWCQTANTSAVYDRKGLFTFGRNRCLNKREMALKTVPSSTSYIIANFYWSLATNQCWLERTLKSVFLLLLGKTAKYFKVGGCTRTYGSYLMHTR